MANTNVFRGADGTLTLAAAGDGGAEATAASDVVEFYNLNPVGRASSVEIYVRTELLEYHEIGRRHPTQLRPGNIHVSGTIGRAYINGALLRMLLGSGALAERTAEPYPQPAFNIQVRVEDPAAAGTSSTVTVYGAKLENWALNMPEDDFVMEQVAFRGLFISVEDAQAA
jgi:hypothetical protein